MSKKDNTHYIYIAIACVLLFLVWRFKTRVSPPIEEPTAADGSPLQDNSPQIIEGSDAKIPEAKEQLKKRQSLAVKDNLGIKSMPIPKNKSGNYELPVEVVMRKLWCRAGEYEGIKSAVMDFDKKVLLLSIESATSSASVAKPVRINLSEISRGFRHRFKLNISQSTNDLFAISLCSDYKKSGKCRGYRPADYEKINAFQERNPKSKVQEGYTFLYHSFFVKDGNAVTMGSLDFSQDYFQRVSKVLGGEGYEVSSFDDTWKVSRSVRSTPLNLGGGKLVFQIARNDPKCELR